MVVILKMSAKLATPGVIQTKRFWNKSYDVIITVFEVTNKILSSDSNYILDVVMWCGQSLVTNNISVSIL